MIVYDLICREAAHQFEGWFSSSSDYESQLSDGLLVCPVCGSGSIEKAMMAPNVGAKGNQKGVALPSTSDQADEKTSSTPQADVSATTTVQVPAEYKELMGKLAKAQKKVLSKSEWVGDSFTEEARAMHYGEADKKSIHGTASLEDATELEEEGIDITPLPLPVTPPESQN